MSYRKHKHQDGDIKPVPPKANINFDIGEEDAPYVKIIVERALAIYTRNNVQRSVMDITMDIIATHLNGCPLDLKRMSEADDFNLMHDVNGINRHIDRRNAQLRDCFLPRFRLPAESKTVLINGSHTNKA